MFWPSLGMVKPASIESKKIERERKKKVEWERELARVRERAGRRSGVPLGEKSKKKYDDLYAKIGLITRKVWSDDVRACYEATGRSGKFDAWADRLCVRLRDFTSDSYTSGELDRITQEIMYAESSLQRFLDQHRWFDPVFRSQLPDMLRNARSANERRSVMQRMATPLWVDLDEIKNIYLDRIRISNETGVPHDVDHIVPINHRKVCGLHVPWNLQVIPASENRRKSNKFIVS